MSEKYVYVSAPFCRILHQVQTLAVDLEQLRMQFLESAAIGFIQSIFTVGINNKLDSVK